MDKHQKELIAAVVLVIIAFLMVVMTAQKCSRSLSRSPQTAQILTTDATAPSVPLDTGLSKAVLGSEPKSLARASQATTDIEKLPWGRDPFVFDKAILYSPGVDQNRITKLEQLSRLKLTGMILSEDKPSDSIAVINGENLKIGDKVAGFTIREIKTNYVVLDRDNESFILNLWEEEPSKEQGQGPMQVP
jgi:hypothetical protein